MNDEIIAWLIAVGGAAVLLYAYHLKLRTQRERRLAKAAEEFYRNVGPLLKDADVPLEVIDLLSFLNRHITNRSLARMFLFFLLWRRRQVIVPPSSSASALDEVVFPYYMEQRKELLEFFVGACASGSCFAVLFSLILTSIEIGRPTLWRRYGRVALMMANTAPHLLSLFFFVTGPRGAGDCSRACV